MNNNFTLSYFVYRANPQSPKSAEFIKSFETKEEAENWITNEGARHTYYEIKEVYRIS